MTASCRVLITFSLWTVSNFISLCRQSAPYSAIFFTRIDISRTACNVSRFVYNRSAANGVVAYPCSWTVGVRNEALLLNSQCFATQWRHSVAIQLLYTVQAVLDRCQRPAKALAICAWCWIAAWWTLLWRTLEISCNWQYYTMIIRTMPLYSCIYNRRLVAWVTIASKRDGSSVRHNAFSGCSDTASNRVNSNWEETPDKLLQGAIMDSVVESWKSLTGRQPTIDYIFMPRYWHE